MTQQPVKTPCIKVCAIDGKSGHCLGCYRTLKEIGGWMSMSDSERDIIIADIPNRKNNQTILTTTAKA